MGEFEEASFKISSNISDEHYSAGDDLYYVGEGLEHEIDKFFADDVCPKSINLIYFYYKHPRDFTILSTSARPLIRARLLYLLSLKFFWS